MRGSKELLIADREFDIYFVVAAAAIAVELMVETEPGIHTS